MNDAGARATSAPSRPRARAQTVCMLLRYAWAMPATLVGLTVLACARASGATVRRESGALEVWGGALGRAVARAPRTLRFSAITLGHVIVGVDAPALQRARAHEHVHVRQYERWGILFFALYAGSSIVELLRGRRPYRDNWFEREAYRLAPDACAPTADGQFATAVESSSASRATVA